MNVTLHAAVHLGPDYLENPRFTNNHLLKSVKEELFQMTEKQTDEISGHTWRWTTLLCDKALEITIAETNVFADSVLRLGLVSGQPVEVWKNKNKWYLEDRYLKDLNRIDGEPMEFEWKKSQDSTH